MQCVISHNRGRRAGLHHSPGDAKHGALAWPTVDKVPCEDDRARRVCSSQVPRSPLTVGLGFKRHRADRQRRFDRFKRLNSVRNADVLCAPGWFL